PPDEVPVVVGQFAPLLAGLALHLGPSSLDHIPVHRRLLAPRAAEFAAIGRKDRALERARKRTAWVGVGTLNRDCEGSDTPVLPGFCCYDSLFGYPCGRHCKRMRFRACLGLRSFASVNMKVRRPTPWPCRTSGTTTSVAGPHVGTDAGTAGSPTCRLDGVAFTAVMLDTWQPDSTSATQTVKPKAHSPFTAPSASQAGSPSSQTAR